MKRNDFNPNMDYFKFYDGRLQYFVNNEWLDIVVDPETVDLMFDKFIFEKQLICSNGTIPVQDDLTEGSLHYHRNGIYDSSNGPDFYIPYYRSMGGKQLRLSDLDYSDNKVRFTRFDGKKCRLGVDKDFIIHGNNAINIYDKDSNWIKEGYRFYTDVSYFSYDRDKIFHNGREVFPNRLRYDKESKMVLINDYSCGEYTIDNFKPLSDIKEFNELEFFMLKCMDGNEYLFSYGKLCEYKAIVYRNKLFINGIMNPRLIIYDKDRTIEVNNIGLGFSKIEIDHYDNYKDVLGPNQYIIQKHNRICDIFTGKYLDGLTINKIYDHRTLYYNGFKISEENFTIDNENNLFLEDENGISLDFTFPELYSRYIGLGKYLIDTETKKKIESDYDFQISYVDSYEMHRIYYKGIRIY